jgi:hypothetical protein
MTFFYNLLKEIGLLELVHFVSRYLPVWYILLICSLLIVIFLTVVIHIKTKPISEILRKIRHYSILVFIILCFLSSPVYFIYNKTDITVFILNNDRLLKNVDVTVHSYKDYRIKNTGQTGYVTFSIDKKVDAINISINKEGYKSYNEKHNVVNEKIIKVHLVPTLVKVNFIQPEDYLDISNLSYLPIHAKFYDKQGEPFYVENPANSIKILADDRDIDFNNSLKANKLCSIKCSDRITSNEYPLGSHKVTLRYENSFDFHKEFVLYKAYDFNREKYNKYRFENRSSFNFDKNGINLCLGRKNSYGIMWIPLYLDPSKPARLDIQSAFYNNRASITLNIGTIYRILLGEGDLKSVKLQGNIIMSDPPSWKTIETQNLEHPISVDTPIIFSIIYNPSRGFNNNDNNIAGNITVEVRYKPNSFNSDINNELLFRAPIKFKIDCKQNNIGLGAILYSKMKEKAIRLWSLKVNNGFLQL